MRVYRVEHPYDGYGPYGGENRIYSLNYAHQDADHPSPQKEGMEMCYSDYCGTASLEKLFVWFSGWWGRLEEQGFHLAIYEVSEDCVEEGKMQLIFDKSAASLITSMPLAENGELIAWLHSSSPKTTSTKTCSTLESKPLPTWEQSALAALQYMTPSAYVQEKASPSAFSKTEKTSPTTTAAGWKNPTPMSFTVASPSSHPLTVSARP